MKKLLAILICLMLTLCLLASCGEDNDTDNSDNQSSEKSDAAVSSDSGDADDITDGSGSESTGNGSVADSGTGDGSTDVSTGASIDNGGGTDGKKDTVTVYFKGNAGYGVALEGSSVVEIEKGSALGTSQLPLAKREGYVFTYWSYDTKGNSQWKVTDAFDEDTVLYANWSADDSVGDLITITFTCMGGTYQSGDTEIKINTGSAISKEQFPVYTRKGYVAVWSYDMFGTDKWSARDSFDKDTELFVTWIKEDSYFDVINSYLFSIGSVEISSAFTVKGADEAAYYLEKYEGYNVYSGMSSGNLKEEYWYVDGIFYSAYGGEKIKKEITSDDFEADYKVYFVGPDKIFQLRKDTVTNITKNGNEYVLEVDADKHVGAGAVTGVEIKYTSFTMTVTFGDDGEISQMRAEYAYSINGGKTIECVTVSEFTGIGETTVEVPENADEFVSK